MSLRKELKVAYCLNPDVNYCDKCVICKNTDKIVDEFIKKLNQEMYSGNEFNPKELIDKLAGDKLK